MKALAAFEAAARLGSFTRAGHELYLTHGAISRQIAALEEHFNRPLFVRLARGVALTQAGLHLYQTVQEMLSGLVTLSRELREELPICDVHISVTPSFGARWLLPRLPQFNVRYPEITVHMDASLSLADIERTRFDFAVRDGMGKWDGMQAELLLRHKLMPVCRQDQIKRLGAIKGGRYALPLLHDTNDAHWRYWLQEIDRLDVLENSDGIVLNDYNLIIESVLNGVGIAMGYSELIADFLADGRLIAPFDIYVDSPRAYYLVKPAHRLRKPAQILWDWMLLEARNKSVTAEQLA